MSHKTGQSRLQFGLFATPLEDMIDADNPVRVIDAFVDVLDLEQLGFQRLHPARRGAPPFHPGNLLKLYLYGYFPPQQVFLPSTPGPSPSPQQCLRPCCPRT